MSKNCVELCYYKSINVFSCLLNFSIFNSKHLTNLVTTNLFTCKLQKVACYSVLFLFLLLVLMHWCILVYLMDLKYQCQTKRTEMFYTVDKNVQFRFTKNGYKLSFFFAILNVYEQQTVFYFFNIF